MGARSTSPVGRAGASNGGTSVQASGEGAFTLSQLASAPATTAGLASVGHYFDVEVARGSSFGSLSVRDCNLGLGNALEWWSGSRWELVRPQSYSAGPPACVSAVLGATSSPALSQLTGTPFAVVRFLAPANGYWLASQAGPVASIGRAARFAPARHLTRPVAGIAATPDGRGYWLAAQDGGVLSFGDAHFFGSAAGKLAKGAELVGIAATPDGRGYWLATSAGQVLSFGDAHGYGSAKHLARPVVGIAATPDGRGYWLAAQDGGVLSFGDAHFFGSGATRDLARPVVGIAATPDGGGCWLVAQDGGVLSFGDAHFFGSAAGKFAHVVGMARS